ncbi:WxL domain-containing protein [Carnobacterium gallinarum]|uniref:WxL domain-containing protein n=1 Tax=Carnobacterium gallinarum TaxID=2749 RepID=UPI00054CFDBB|nr:WxL domain-containing protein [Carnobacterium gallinarum]
MKKRNMVTFTMVSLLAPLFLIGSGDSVLAATAGTMNSISDVTFTQDTAITPPVNPLDPTDPVTPVDPANPNDPHSPGTAGPLSIDYVSNFHFGSQTVQTKDSLFYAKLDAVKEVSSGNTISVPNYVQVTDKRGLNTGWKLTVKQNGQFKTADTTPATLTNAVLTLNKATTKSQLSLTLAPVTSIAILDPTGTASSTVAVAAPATGMGTWISSFGSDTTTGAQAISLAVPLTTAKVQNSQYKTSLTWNLEDSPL